MKSTCFRVAGIVLIVFGVVGAATEIDDFVKGAREDTVLGGAMSVCFIIGGVLILRALKSGYHLGWRIMLGAFMIFFAMVGVGVEVDSIINQTSEEPAVGFTLVGIFAVSGLLLARSGHRRNVPLSRARPEQQMRDPIGRRLEEQVPGPSSDTGAATASSSISRTAK
jgi:predicted anti-sigma-YlaC factor YlaD